MLSQSKHWSGGCRVCWTFFSGPLGGGGISLLSFEFPPQTITNFVYFLDILHIFSPHKSNFPPKNYISTKNPGWTCSATPDHRSWNDHWLPTQLLACNSLHPKVLDSVYNTVQSRLIGTISGGSRIS